MTSTEHLEELDRLRQQVAGYQSQAAEVEQILGKALGYPKLPEDWDTDDVCVGAHTIETLAEEAAELILFHKAWKYISNVQERHGAGIQE